MKNIVDAAGLIIKNKKEIMDCNVIFIKKDDDNYYYNIYPLYIIKYSKELVKTRIVEWLVRRGYSLQEVNNFNHLDKIYSYDYNPETDDSDEYYTKIMNKMIKEGLNKNGNE